MRWMNVVRGSIVVGLALLVLVLAGCGTPTTPGPVPGAELERVTLHLNWLHGTGFLGFYVAQAQGFYAEEGLEVTIEELDDPANGPLVPERVAVGELEFAIGGQDAKRVQNAGGRLTAIGAMYQLGPAAFFARADSGIVTPADLLGRTIVLKGPAWEQLLVTILENGELTIDDVEVVPGGYDMTPFLEGEVEVWAGWVTEEVVRARMQGIEVVTFPLHEYGIYRNAVEVYTSQTLLETDHDLVERFLRASIRGWDWATKNPEAAVEIMVVMFPEMAAERDFHLESFWASIPLIVPGGSRLGEINCETWEASELLADLEDKDDTCTTEVFEAVAEQ